MVFCYLGPTVSKTIENDITMETNKKELYEAPSILVMEVKVEGVVCASPYGTQDYNPYSLDED